MKKAILGWGVAVALAAALVPSTASAAGCSGRGPTVTDYAGNRWATTYCHNYQGEYTRTNTITGWLFPGRNWFVCQARGVLGENPPVGNARNDIWLYTQGDVSYNDTFRGWGWFPATKVSGGGNYQPIPGLRWC